MQKMQLFSICHLCLFPRCLHLIPCPLSDLHCSIFFFAIVIFAFLKLAFFNSIFFAIVIFAFLKLALFNPIFVCNCHFWLSQTGIFHFHFFAFVIFAFLWVAFFQSHCLHCFCIFSSWKYSRTSAIWHHKPSNRILCCYGWTSTAHPFLRKKIFTLLVANIHSETAPLQ